jgi:hypothetical protein
LVESLVKLSHDMMREYSPIAFWFWNAELDSKELQRQVKEMVEQGVYGGFMHPRPGMTTKYFSDEHWQLMKDTIDTARQYGFNAWLYDEFGWPSGTAGITDPQGTQTYSLVMRHGRKFWGKFLRVKMLFVSEGEEVELGSGIGADLELIAIEADRFFRGHAEADRPFFVSIGFQEVHRNFGSVYDKKLLDKIQIPGYLPDLEITRKDIASFYENIRIADSAVGRILQAVKDSGFEENTLIYFTTDHGAEFPRAKMTLYDPGIKTSLIMRYPRVIKAGMRVKDLVSHVDIMPTLLDAAGLEIPENVQGRSFWGLFTGETYIPRDEIFAQRTWHGGEYDPMRCIRTERYKYIRNWMPGWPVQMGAYVRRYGEEVINQFYSDVRPQEELYDLYNDEWEQVNVIDKDEYRDIRRDLSQRLYTFSEEINDPILQGHISRPKGGRVGYNCLWGKFPTREPETEDYRMSIVLLDDEYGDGPLVI